jgi:hypothetical protein
VPDEVLIDNRTELPDEVVREAVESYWVENASLAGSRSSFQTYAAEGSLLARSKFQAPRNVFDAIRLARDLAERDDDVAGTIGAMTAVAFGDGMRNFHEDEKTVDVFNEAARHMNLDGAFKRLYREYLIAGSVTSVSLYQRTTVDIGDREETIVAPLIGKLDAERIRVIGSDIFDNADLAYVPEPRLERWLQEYHAPKTTPARRAEMRKLDPVSATLFLEPVKIENLDDFIGSYTDAYRLNPTMAHRTSMPKDGSYAQPPMTRNFALLEAKRLLNLMDYALLQGGINFIVVAKKGTDERPALQPEIDNLVEVVRRATKTGVVVGDHRLSFEIVTPKLDELLNASKRNLLGRKIAMALLRVPEHATEAPGQEGMRADIELIARVVTSDRQDIKRHVERFVYDETAKRNSDLVSNGSPRIWFAKVILQGSQYFTDFVLKLRDRGDIPRQFAAEAAGFDWEAGVAQRKRELAENIDETMTPAAVPFTNPAAGPQDNNSGRPVGGSSANGAPGSQPPATTKDNVRPLRTVNKNAGETVKAFRDEETGETQRAGERTYEILAEYMQTREVGRITPIERRALDEGQPIMDGPTAVVPVNPGFVVTDIKAIRLAPGVSMLLGTRKGDGALVAKALSFREPEFDLLAAEETALKWGFPIEGWEQLEEIAAAPAAPAPTIVIDTSRRTRKTVRRDANDNIIGIDEEPID